MKPLINKIICFDFKIKEKNPYITQLKYYQKKDFEADPIDKLKPWIKKNYLFRFQNQLNFLI